MLKSSWRQVLSIAALDVVRSRDTASYQEIAASFFDTIKASKGSDVFASMISDALMTSAFGLEEKQTSTSFAMISAKALRGEISIEDYLQAVEKERTAISTSLADAQDLAESLRPRL